MDTKEVTSTDMESEENRFDFQREILDKSLSDEQVKINMLQGMYLTVNKYNEHAIDVYKHYGFKIVDSVVTDIGNGFVMDDYIMYKNKE